ncbi:MAG: AMP-binding protein [Proteobacteria bacterium]|nr:AMP-binding protein [Pseudomonadota bacterium]
MNLATLLHKSAMRWANRPAITRGSNTVLSYAQFFQRTAQLAAGMRDKLGLVPGDRIALAMSNCTDYAVVLFAAWHGGFAAVPMNAKRHSREFAYILADSEARVCFVTSNLASAIEDAAAEAPSLQHIINIDGGLDEYLGEDGPAAEVAPDDLAWLFYTSGTTGRPKGAMASHRNLLMMTVGYYGDVDLLTEQDSILHAAPMSHGSGLYILPYVAKGGCQVIPESGGFDPTEVIELLQVHRNIGAFFAPTMVKRLISHPAAKDADFTNLKTIVYGGGPMYVVDCQEALDVLGPKLVQIYGQGESPMTITALSRSDHTDESHPRYLDRLASVGTARTDVEVRVADANDEPMPAGDVGEILVRGDVVMTGYWHNETATAVTLRGGWLHTGDMGAFDEDGYLTLKDRSKDVIISGGSNIYPHEIEEILLTHPDVAEVSVIGHPHPDWGEEVVAFVVLHGSEIDETSLDTLCLDNIARFKRPKRYIVVDGLPKNNYGKILKTSLREQLANDVV